MAGPEQLPPTVLVIFGITGSLASQKLLPALYELLRHDRLPGRFSIIGVFRSDQKNLDDVLEDVRVTLLRDHREAKPEILAKLRGLMRPIMMDSTHPADFDRLRQMVEEIDQEFNTQHNCLFYLAIPPAIFKSVVGCLAEAGLNTHTESATHRILIEKPFGSDLASARDLGEYLCQHFSENQVYRIDHYLAKETAQNILAFRFNNPLIEDIWGRQFIDHIQITVSEAIGIQGRAAFYESMGAMRDIMQSHILQLMALITMEAPATMTSNDIHLEKLLLLNSVLTIKPNHVNEVSVRGQYQGYREEVHNPASKVETFAALKLEVANSRWGGVPILLRTGKALKAKSTEITVVFKDRSRRNVPENLLTIWIQPNEGISLRLTAKKPGFSNELQPVNMNFSYQTSFEHNNPDAYERVLIDTINGDQSLFATNAEVLRCWEILNPVLQTWLNHPDQPDIYPVGTWGPPCADELANSFGMQWLSDMTQPNEPEPKV